MSLLLTQLGAPPAAEAETLAPLSVRLGYRGYVRSPYLRSLAVDSVVEQLSDAGSNLLVVPTWGDLRLTRALRFSYWNSDLSGAAAAPVEADTLAQFLVRLPFRSLGRSQYLHHRDYDSAPVVVQESTLAPYLVRVPFKTLGRNRYLWNTAQDFDAPAAPADSTFAQFFVRVPFVQFKRRPQLGWNSSIEGIEQLNDAGSNILVVASFESWRLAKAGRFFYWTPPQDFDAPPVGVEADTWLPFLIRQDITSRFRGALIAQLLLSRGTAQDEDAPAPSVSGGVFIPTFRTRRGR